MNETAKRQQKTILLLAGTSVCQVLFKGQTGLPAVQGTRGAVSTKGGGLASVCVFGEMVGGRESTGRDSPKSRHMTEKRRRHWKQRREMRKGRWLVEDNDVSRSWGNQEDGTRDRG